MKYSINNNVLLLDTRTAVGVLSCDLKSFHDVASIAYDAFSRSILICGILSCNAPKATPKGKWPYRLYRANGTEFDLVYPEFCGEHMPFGNEGLIALDIGGGVAVLDSMGGVFAKARFGVYKHVNSQISSNPSGTKVSIVQWKGDYRKLMILDLDTKELRYYPVSIFDYTWRNDEELLIGTFSGFKILNSTTGKTQDCLKNPKSIFDIAINSPNDLPKTNKDFKWDGVEFDLVKAFNEKIYLHWNSMLLGNIQLQQKYQGILSMNCDFSDPKIEYFSTGETMIREFQVDANGLIDAYGEIGSDYNVRQQENGTATPNKDNSNHVWRILPSYRNPIFWIFHLVDLKLKKNKTNNDPAVSD